MSTERLQEILLDQYVRNREVREYFKNIRFDEDDMLRFIDEAYADIREKLASIRALQKFARNHLESKGKKNVDIKEKIYSKVIELIFSPKQRCVYHVKFTPVIGRIDELRMVDLVQGGSVYELYLGSMEEVLEAITEQMEYQLEWRKGYGDTTGGAHWKGAVISMIMVPQGEKAYNPVEFSVDWVNNKPVIFHFEISDEWSKTFMEEEEKNLYWDIYMSLVRRTLPYEPGVRLRLQTPMMKTPITGVFQTEDDGCGCRYNWLYMDSAFAANKECKYIDLSYTKLDADVAGKYTTWDWLERI